jgi:single-strand DNA-binding protein
MADINHVVLVGRLTRDAELKFTNSGLAICNMSVALNRRVKQGEQWIDEPNFFDVTIFGKQGEAIAQYLTKGKQVGLDGELRQDRWEQDGQKRSKVFVVANNVQLLGGGAGGGRNAPGSGFSGGERPVREQGSGNASQKTAPEEFEDDIPF